MKFKDVQVEYSVFFVKTGEEKVFHANFNKLKAEVSDDDLYAEIQSKYLEVQDEKTVMYPLDKITVLQEYDEDDLIRRFNYIDPDTGELMDVADYMKDKNATTSIDTSPVTPNSSTISNTYSGETEINLVEEIAKNIKSLSAWDPRLTRFDEFFNIPVKGENSKLTPIRVPFASATAATAFSDISNVMEVGLIPSMIAEGGIKGDSYIGKKFKSTTNVEYEDSTIAEQISAGQAIKKLSGTEKVITHNTEDYEQMKTSWGVQSIVNPYSLTKLVGGVLADRKSGTVKNYMYDIRDQRRFYDMQGEGSDATDILSISNPTVTQLINWSNSDLWGRTPYSFQDFVYCKFFGLIPNNRLITLRRYKAPTYDNLQFPGMNGPKENADDYNNPNNKVFSPVSYVVTWFGGDTGNSLNTLMSFSTGINWGDLESKMWSIDGDTGESKQAVIDRLLGNAGNHTGLFGGAENSTIDNFLKSGSLITSKITSFGKFALSLNGDLTQDQEAYDHLRGANVDPYESTFVNRIQGPVNRIDKVKKREPGIKFSQTLNIKCAYKAKSIGGINPKAALLDVLGNCLEMVSPHAVFWGGGHRFNIHPRLYPFHDKGWRDDFMEKIYDGKILGDGGAISTVLSGMKKVGQNANGGSFSMDDAKGILGQLGGTALGLLSSAISSLSGVLGGSLDGVADSLLNAGADMSGEDKEQLKERSNNKLNSMFNNLNQLWHNKMMKETTLPSIRGNGNILVGEPVGEWHLTVGNPLNPIMVIGNLVCSEMKVSWDEELGPDDFPTGFSVEYTLEHGMARDSDGIQSMFNRGMGKYYTLPDYISTSSDRITYVDKFTKNAGTGDTGTIPYKQAGDIIKEAGWAGDQVIKISEGVKPKNSGNYNISLITKYNPINSEADRSIIQRRSGNGTAGYMAHIKSLAATRKQINN